ncbi:hypothetical protein H2509_14765 [Stappia sp. F7233]|uniref:Thiol:disulfide interchange protein DsbD N-terminal domain-containing protein n=1 Tax=Stappia albiluteola TaxID=2758565 RepID=A0A839AIP7_9HYPH|nr:protein-disulfide reductase DsbD domain-containing protein [Stappia albiluteola]MBA5778389.1 hypothetical protein [Stappia albiluteola]
MRNSSASYLIACFLALASMVAQPAAAAVTDWTDVMGGRVRLIAAGGDNGAYDAGLEFELEPGWHIYWRFPGESGVPTEADFQASTNLAAATLLFPAPERFYDGYSTAIVYHDQVVLPVRLEAEDKTRPVTLSADVRFGICREICVPAQAELSLILSPETAADEEMRAKLDAASKALPKPQNDAAPRIASITGPGAGKMLRISVELADGSTPFDLFAEGAPGSYIEVPRLVEASGKSAVFELSTDGLLPNGDKAPLLLVLTHGDAAVEYRTEIPLSAGN